MYKRQEFDSLISGVASGKYDFVMAGMTVTEERKQMVSFSNTYATGVQVIIVKDCLLYTSYISEALAHEARQLKDFRVTCESRPLEINKDGELRFPE